ncbi:hypothetical protein [Pinibacter aurantiacus]|uniref:Uncharacterized protein n=1 Tax=Pinibacter aurantiacus TaxID=2851599 RepID=A0A9E2SGY8_9BACT|nr:hypothetical protein [Pinibacter aurantiacus]MBV4360655.1 hypothetical protein [Pinibacter aurantiacus]
MPILANSKQSVHKDLIAFYSELTDSDNAVTRTIGLRMLELIEMINQIFPATQICGLTSLYRLVLQAKDQWDSEWFVIVSCAGNNEYYFEYLMTDDKKPWQNARVTGGAINLAEAKKYLLIAMKESNGWKDCSELQMQLVMNDL